MTYNSIILPLRVYTTYSQTGLATSSKSIIIIVYRVFFFFYFYLHILKIILNQFLLTN